MTTKVALICKNDIVTRVRIDGQDVAVKMAGRVPIGGKEGVNLIVPLDAVTVSVGGVQVPAVRLSQQPINGEVLFVIGLTDVDAAYETET